MRLKAVPLTTARARTTSVLPSPGAPSTSTCPFASRATSVPRTSSSCPTTTRAICLLIRSNAWPKSVLSIGSEVLRGRRSVNGGKLLEDNKSVRPRRTGVRGGCARPNALAHVERKPRARRKEGGDVARASGHPRTQAFFHETRVGGQRMRPVVGARVECPHGLDVLREGAAGRGRRRSGARQPGSHGEKENERRQQ